MIKMQIFGYLVLAFALLMARHCEGQEGCLKESDPMGATYSGTISNTENGLECQRWDTNKPHTPTQTPDDTDNNYCRNPKPDASTSNKPWCYTTHPKIEYEYCSIKACDSKPILECLEESDPMGATYRGTTSQTANGLKCQRWDTNKPHTPSEKPDDTDNNYCRNPKPNEIASNKPWCYTTHPKIDYEYCSIKTCETGPILECLGESDPMGAAYRGTNSKTESGRECQRWDTDEPHKPSEMPKDKNNNYCRNPKPDAVASPRPWCYTTDTAVNYEYCSINTCGESNWCLRESDPMGATYGGTLSETEYEVECQRWDTDEPHERKSERGIPKVTDNNYCRNPKPDANTSPKPWCYTTDIDRNFEYCDLFVCEKVIQDCLKKSDPMGATYSGTTSQTENGLECQRWDTNYPHTPLQTPKDMDNNYCRNPAPDASTSPRPWCYTTDSKVEIEFCSIPFCDSCDGFIYDNKCFTPEDIEECKRRGGLMANLYSEFHMIQVMNYLRKKSGSTYVRIGLNYDPVADRISLRDGTDAPAGLRWHPQAPFRLSTTGINMGLIVGPDPSDNYQYLMNTDRENSFVLCETELQK